MDLPTFLYYLSWALLVSGSFFCIVGGIGLIRFPDFYTRMHAAGVTDTLGASLILVGLMIQATHHHQTFTNIAKLILILLFLLLTSATSSHALAKSALNHGPQPLLDETPHASSDSDDD
ncbi:MAG: sodium:proton antiporter [Deltaproteobacteria bacterium]|nr:sodium:proton antiporter [Deltaproteobacteria bacterium]|tara:strand:+ start:3614 stop:3970 length:357 start_codon:yes stop_codon:yes gene_type:complete